MAFWCVGVVLGAVTFAASAPSPLYAVWQERFAFSATTLTVVFAVYAAALVVALLLAGSVSDLVGRRPVLIASLAVLAVAMVVFALASGVGWLVVARVLQGVGTGVATGTLSAALLDLQPRPGAGPNASAVAPSFGLAAGSLGAGALVQHGPAPRQLVFWLLLAVFALACLVVVAIPEQVPYRRGWLRTLRPRIGVPPAARGTFLTVGPIIGAAWALAGFYLSLGPSLAATLAGSTDRLVAGLPGVALFLGGGVGTLVAVRTAAERAISLGAPLLVVGVGVTLAGIAAESMVVYVLGSAVAGIGFGPTFAGSLRALAPLVAITERAALLTAVYVLSYVAFSAPAVVAGVTTTRSGLRPTADVYAAAVLAVAAIATAAHLLRLRRAAPSRRDYVPASSGGAET